MIWAILIFLCLPAQAASTYDSIETEFSSAAEPLEKNVMGYWAGNCSPRSEPTTYWPAVLLVKEVPDPAGNYASLSYYWERAADRDLFRNMTPAQVEAHKSVKEWFAKEQWTKLHSCHGALVNRYSASGTQHIRRELRVLENEFQSRLLLRAVRVEDMKEANLIYCEFDKSLGAFKSAPPSINDSFNFGGTGLVQNRAVVVTNSNPTRVIERLTFTNQGTAPVILYDVNAVSAGGYLVRGVSRIHLPVAASYTLRRTRFSPTYLREIRFNLSGRSENIEILGFSTP